MPVQCDMTSPTFSRPHVLKSIYPCSAWNGEHYKIIAIIWAMNESWFNAKRHESFHTSSLLFYVPPTVNAKDAANVISGHLHDLETSARDAFKIITGDFIHWSLKASTTSYFQHVKCSTRKDRILDQCYTNVQVAYTSVFLPPFGRSDHNLVQFIPRYRLLVQREPTITRTIKEWSADAI